MQYSSISDIGLLREKNQDSLLTITNQYGDFLAIVADGIGGGLAGEVASSEIVNYFEKNFKESGKFTDLQCVIDYLKLHISLANKTVYTLAKKNPEYKGMGSTLTGILICEFGVVSFNCGDSRVYGLLDNKIFHLTVDHTLVNQMLENNEITLEEAVNHPKKHYLVKAIGIIKDIEADIHKVKDLQYYLICSDGLHNLVNEEEIVSIVYDSSLTLDEKVEELKNKALLAGGYDNITIILVER